MFRRILSSLGLGMAQALDPNDFTRLAHDIFQEHAPNHKIEIVAPLQFAVTPPEGGSQTVFLDNLYKNCAANPGQCKADISRFAKVMLGGSTADAILPKNIIPLVRNADWIAEYQNLFHGKVEAGKPQPNLCTESLGADLSIVYVCDNPETVQYITLEDIAEVHLFGGTLRELAIENLSALLEEIKSEGASGFFYFSANNCYEPSLLLLDRIWKKFHEQIKGEIVFSIPARDALFVADSAVPEAIAHLAKITPEVFRKGAYSISERLYVRRAEGIAFYSPDQQSLAG